MAKDAAAGPFYVSAAPFLENGRSGSCSFSRNSVRCTSLSGSTMANIWRRTAATSSLRRQQRSAPASVTTMRFSLRSEADDSRFTSPFFTRQSIVCTIDARETASVSARIDWDNGELACIAAAMVNQPVRLTPRRRRRRSNACRHAVAALRRAFSNRSSRSNGWRVASIGRGKFPRVNSKNIL